jgi:protein-S-isoprenylcysteine O-methyltransferase Ste14
MKMLPIPPVQQPVVAPGALYEARADRLPFGVRAGAWAFCNRSWLPVPLALAVVLTTVGEVDGPWPVSIGILLIAAGVLLRAAGVHHIGSISRTRTTRLGPALITSGPFRFVRNPLYLGNWCIWTGLVFVSRLLWMLPVAWTMFALQYGTIVMWEEMRLRASFGPAYERYTASVPRWFPSWSSGASVQRASHSWWEVAHSERGTAIAIGAVVLALLLKAQFS